LRTRSGFLQWIWTVSILACLAGSAGAISPAAEGDGQALDPLAAGAEEPPGEDLSFRLSDGLYSGQALEKALAGEGYRVGPGDELAIGIWGDIPAVHQLVVTPEGKLLIPFVGEIFVNGLLLPEATRHIQETLLHSYRDVLVTVTLLRLRTFQVHVVGEVLHPGTYGARAVDRASAVIFRAGGLTDLAGSRRVEIRNADTLRAVADLVRFVRAADLSANPRLQDGDVVFVPLRRERVWVYGAVQRPGGYELVPGDSLGGLVRLAGGLQDGAVVDSVAVSSYADDGVTSLRRTITMADGDFTSGPVSRLRLQNDDRVFIQRRPKWHEERLVRVEGEVSFPGIYDIDPEKTSLADVIRRAGGFTAEAALEEAQVIRTRGEAKQDREFERLLKLDPSELRTEENDYVRARSRQREGRMAVDFVRLFIEGDRSQDITLEPDDVIRVPPRRNYVKVMGRVLRPGNVIYKAGADADYYVAEAGGFTWNAQKSKVRVIKAITGQWLKKGDVGPLDPGDTVWVPEKPDRDYWRFVKETVAFLTGLATIYIVVDNATK
jgi:protein involved in polysaccharide export with SLBB domain